MEGVLPKTMHCGWVTEAKLHDQKPCKFGRVLRRSVVSPSRTIHSEEHKVGISSTEVEESACPREEDAGDGIGRDVPTMRRQQGGAVQHGAYSLESSSGFCRGREEDEIRRSTRKKPSPY
jgi:hypothetical protein